MARIDKAWVIVRGIAGTALTGVLGVRFSTGGSVIAAGTGVGVAADGLVVIPGTITAGRPVGVLTHGEVVEFGGSAATDYYAGSTGTLGTVATNATHVGKTIEGDRLIVHF